MIVKDQPPVGPQLADAKLWQRALATLPPGRHTTAEVVEARFPDSHMSYRMTQKRSTFVRQLRKAAYADLFNGEWMGNRWEWWMSS